MRLEGPGRPLGACVTVEAAWEAPSPPPLQPDSTAGKGGTRGAADTHNPPRTPLGVQALLVLNARGGGPCSTTGLPGGRHRTHAAGPGLPRGPSGAGATGPSTTATRSGHGLHRCLHAIEAEGKRWKGGDRSV
jgi:hypothetical protein